MDRRVLDAPVRDADMEDATTQLLNECMLATDANQKVGGRRMGRNLGGGGCWTHGC